MYDRPCFKIWFISIYKKLSPCSITVTVTHFSFFGSRITLPDFLAKSIHETPRVGQIFYTSQEGPSTL